MRGAESESEISITSDVGVVMILMVAFRGERAGGATSSSSSSSSVDDFAADGPAGGVGGSTKGARSCDVVDGPTIDRARRNGSACGRFDGAFGTVFGGAFDVVFGGGLETAFDLPFGTARSLPFDVAGASSSYSESSS